MRDTIDMAREAGAMIYNSPHDSKKLIDIMFTPETVEHFVALVRADERSVEREACAKVCEDIYMRGYGNCGDAYDAIRERSSSHSESANAGARGNT
jgi:hypothetical protein